jgi:hypothetical protein
VAPATSKRATSPSDPTGSSCDGKHPGQQRISSFRGADLWLALNARAFDPREANLRGATSEQAASSSTTRSRRSVGAAARWVLRPARRARS